MSEPLTREERDSLRSEAGELQDHEEMGGWASDTLRLISDLERVERERDDALTLRDNLSDVACAEQDRARVAEAKLARIVAEIESGEADPRAVLAIAKEESTRASTARHLSLDEAMVLSRLIDDLERAQLERLRAAMERVESIRRDEARAIEEATS